MPIFTIEIEERAVLAFVAPNLFTAEAAMEDESEQIMAGLRNIANPDGSPLLDGGAEVAVRESNEAEEARWHAGVALAIQEGSLKDAHDAVVEGFAVYLVPVMAANDDIELELEDN